ncbi:MAG TPA: AbrB/MazE/SpoVT family DNA-binding domain-containing protein [Syntrophomonadaceae bacterium]|nr:AbrB/MazE/SpoVT family DNA-binding domain-containing protein [Syntrophomonadaceae bacterium]
MNSKKINKAGGLTIPSDIRRSHNIFPGDAVDIDIEGSRIILTAHIDRCCMCRSENEVVTYKGKVFCEECIKALGGLINE